VLIVDLDAHQGNGNEEIFKDDPRVRIFDIYNEAIYPQDDAAKASIAFDYPVPVSTGDEAYLGLLEEELPKAIENVGPGLIVFIAGTDVLEGDFLGMLRLSDTGVVKRDAIVFSNALKRKIPILMLLGGGYTKRSAPVIAASIENIVKMVRKGKG
jgi:histone deacetylase 11